jgi:hypothetical protein
VAVSPSLYFLFKPRFDAVDVDYLEPERDAGRVSLVALSYANSGDPIRPNSSPLMASGRFQLLSEPQVPQLTRLFGRAVSRSSNIWIPAMYARGESDNERRGTESRPPGG